MATSMASGGQGLASVHAPRLVPLAPHALDGGVHRSIGGEDPRSLDALDARVVAQPLCTVGVDEGTEGAALKVGADAEREHARARRLLHTAQQRQETER